MNTRKNVSEMKELYMRFYDEIENSFDEFEEFFNGISRVDRRAVYALISSSDKYPDIIMNGLRNGRTENVALMFHDGAHVKEEYLNVKKETPSWDITAIVALTTMIAGTSVLIMNDPSVVVRFIEQYLN